MVCMNVSTKTSPHSTGPICPGSLVITITRSVFLRWKPHTPWMTVRQVPVPSSLMDPECFLPNHCPTLWSSVVPPQAPSTVSIASGTTTKSPLSKRNTWRRTSKTLGKCHQAFVFPMVVGLKVKNSLTMPVPLPSSLMIFKTYSNLAWV